MNWRIVYHIMLAGLLWPLALTAQTLSGRVLGYHANRIGDYDGLQLRTATGQVWLRFPPHVAAQVLKLALIGQLVTATTNPAPPGPPGGSAPPPGPAYRLATLHNPVLKTSFRVADFPPPPPAAGKLVEADESVTGTLRDEGGRLVALLTDRYLIELKPQQSESIQALLMGAKRLNVVGYERTEPGFTNKTGRILIHPTTLTINGQTFAL